MIASAIQQVTRMSAPSNLFDPAHYADVRRPLLEASCLPAWCYTSHAFYQREVERVFMKSWHLVGREDEIPEPGDYLVHDMCGESTIVMRSDDGEVRAFANACRHRGTRLLESDGHCRAIICPYHAWTFNRQGELSGVRGMEKSRSFEKAENGLMPVRLGTFNGFVFVCFSDEVVDLVGWIGNLPEEFASCKWQHMRVTRRKSYDLRCNWKIYVENAMEDYHTATVHRTSIGLQECERVDSRGEWDSIYAYSERTLAVLREDDVPFPHIEGLVGRNAVNTYFTVIYPATFFGSTVDCMWWLQSIPFAADRMRVTIGSCFPESTVSRPDFENEAAVYYKRWDKALPEDNDISERQQVGLNSSLCPPGRLSVHEPVVHALDNWVLDRVLDPA